jgi:uncharacterized protein (DUF427 family)
MKCHAKDQTGSVYIMMTGKSINIGDTIRRPQPSDSTQGDFIMKAVWQGTVLAESDSTIVVEGNHYFPPNAINKEHFRESSTHTVCGWKGQCSYYDVVVNGEVNKDAAWYYPETKDAAKNIEGYVAFWRGVEVKNS